MSSRRPLTEEQQEARAARLAEHVARAVAAAPPLTDEQRVAIARILIGGGA